MNRILVTFLYDRPGGGIEGVEISEGMTDVVDDLHIRVSLEMLKGL